MDKSEVRAIRKPEFSVDELFVGRWSPRSFDGSKLSHEQLMSLFEAAKWAPSCFNNQPWRFIYAHRETPSWAPVFSLLVEKNQAWVKDASVLICVVSKTTFDFNGKPARTHSLDTGHACENIAIAAEQMGLATHSMAGFDFDRAKKELGVPDDHNVECMMAIGRPVSKEDDAISTRKSVKQISFEGKFQVV